MICFVIEILIPYLENGTFYLFYITKRDARKYIGLFFNGLTLCSSVFFIYILQKIKNVVL